MIKIPTILKLLLPIIFILGFANFSKAQVLDYNSPKDKNWWVMASIGNVSHNLHHTLYTARWGADVEANTEVQNRYFGISYGYVFGDGSGSREYNIDIGYSFLGSIDYQLSHPAPEFSNWHPQETIIVTALESSLLLYYGKKRKGLPYMLRVGYAVPQISSEIINSDNSITQDANFYTNAGPLFGFGLRFHNIILEYKLYMIAFGSASLLFEERKADFSNGSSAVMIGYRF